MDLKLAGRTVLVTGGSRGIGRAIAAGYAAEGARVAITYATDKAAADGVVAGIAEAGGQAAAFALDLTDPAAIPGTVRAVVDRFGGLDVLVGNAVSWSVRAVRPFGETDAAGWEALVRANLFGTAGTVRAALPHLTEAAGRIVLVSSAGTRHGVAGFTAYTTAKTALEGLMVALKWEVGPAGVLVNVVGPGLTITDDTPARHTDEYREALRRRTATGSLSVPADVASAVLYLGSFANTNITGTYLPVTGGM